MTDLDRRAVRTFVELADTLVAGFDLLEFLHLLTARCAEILKVDAAGLLLVDQHGVLNMVAATTEQARLVELFQLENSEGPCLDSFRSGQLVRCADLSAATDRWPLFARAARDAGFGAVYAIPMRLREETIGGLNLFSNVAGGPGDDQLQVAQALADVATIGLLHERTMRRHEVLTEQLQTALNSRILIEQAKGVLAERLGSSVDQAFDTLRKYARSHNRRLIDLAAAVVDNDPTAGDLVTPVQRDSPAGPGFATP